MYRELKVESLPGEIWKDAPQFEELYQVSNLGRVKTKERLMMYDRYNTGKMVPKRVFVRMRKQQINKHTGYLKLGLNLEGKVVDRFIHRLVAEAFLGYQRNGGQKGDSLVVDHINNNKLDNRVENLQIITMADNVRKEKARQRKARLNC